MFMKRAVVLACGTAIFCQPALSQEWFEKYDAKKCAGTVEVCMPDLKALGWGVTSPTNRTPGEPKTEIWAKGRQMILCKWLKDGTQDVSCEVTTFDEE
jgi:hypothetical protein